MTRKNKNARATPLSWARAASNGANVMSNVPTSRIASSTRSCTVFTRHPTRKRSTAGHFAALRRRFTSPPPHVAAASIAEPAPFAALRAGFQRTDNQTVSGQYPSSPQPSGARHVTPLSFARRSGANRFRPDRHARHPELLARLRPRRRHRLRRARAHLRDGVFAARLGGLARLDARASHESRHRT